MRQILIFFFLALLLIVSSCTPQVSSMDEETEHQLIEQYGEPTVVRLSRAGTLRQQLTEIGEQQWQFIRVMGEMNAEDFAYLNSCEARFYVRVLDLLDATILAGDSAYLKNMDEDAYLITEDNVLGSYQFDGLLHLEKLYLPLRLTKIAAKALFGRSDLDYISMPQTLREVGDYAFNGCSRLTSVVLPDSLRIIGNQPFPSSVKSIRIPRSVQTLHQSGVGEFEDIYMEWTPAEVEKFKDVSLEWIKYSHEGDRPIVTFMRPTLHVPADYVEAYKESFRTVCHVVPDETHNP